MGADRGVLACINFDYIHESKLLLVQILDFKMILSFLELGYFRFRFCNCRSVMLLGYK